MGFYYDRASSVSSPVVVLQPQLPSQPYGMDLNSHAFDQSSFFGHASPAPAAPWPQSQPQTPPSAAGRKRSRDEAADNLEEDYFPIAASLVKESEDEWEYGEGMTLIRPNGFIIDASSQTGTWAEEKADISQLQAILSQTPPTNHDRPTLRSYKSQRLDLTATPVIAEEISLNNGTVVTSSPPKSTGTEEPTVDAFTIHLGIGWSRISDDEDIQAAARGWAKYIENHYSVSEAHIRLQSKGLASYLVEAREGWFLFRDDLKEGRLVSTSLERTFENLKTTPPVFDGEELLAAADTPRMESVSQPEVVMNYALETRYPQQEIMMNGTSETDISAPQVAVEESHSSLQPSGHVLDMEMDMS